MASHVSFLVMYDHVKIFICVMPGKVLAKGVDTLYYGKINLVDTMIIFDFNLMVADILLSLQDKILENGTKGINICFNVFGC